MFLLCAPMMTQVLERFGVLCRWRAAMTLDLRRLTDTPRLDPGYEIVAWDPARLEEIAHLDHEAYRDTLDARLYWQYFSTPEGCARMWREALAGKFGRFDAQRTLLLVRDGRICGDVMAAARGTTEGFIGNLAVAPEHRGGTGTALLLTCLRRFQEAGFQRVSLAVTLENRRAYDLYTRLGFVENGRFPLVSRPAEGVQYRAT